MGVTRRSFLQGSVAASALMGFAPLQVVVAETVRTYILKARSATAPLLGKAGPATAIWGYNGQNPGPVLRARQGGQLRVRLENGISQATSIHWHGVRVPNAMDGVSGLTQDAVAPGKSFDYAFPLRDAGTYWYHAHNRTWEQAARGMFGALVVEETTPPRTDHDLVFVIDDWRLGKDGQIDAGSLGDIHDWAHQGRLGNWLTVNGKASPDFAVRAGDRVRLRILNAANARVMGIAFPDHAPQVIAIDGQPVAAPYALSGATLSISPGQRMDLMIDMALAPGTRSPINALVQNQTIPVARFAYDAGAPSRKNPLDAPIALSANPLPKGFDPANAIRATLRMEGGAMGAMRGARLNGKMLAMNDLVAAGKVWAFNGVAGISDTPLVRARSGQSIIIDIINDNRWAHAMHLHGHHFRVMRRKGRAIGNSPLRDTELVLPGEKVSIGFVADAPGKWLLHCHMLEHQAGGMTTWVEIT